MSGFGSRRSVRFLEEIQTGGSGGIGALSGRAFELRRSSRVVGDQRAALPPAARPVRGGGGGGLDRPAARAGFGAAGAGGPDRLCGGAIPDAVLGFHSEALS